jgi:hypothetical protein
MKLQRLSATAAVLLAITMATPVVFAQGGGDRQRPSGSSDRSQRARPSGNQDRGSRADSGRSSGGGERRAQARERSGGGNDSNRGGAILGTRGSDANRGNDGNRGGSISRDDGNRGNRSGGFFGSRTNDGNRGGSVIESRGRDSRQADRGGRAVERREPIRRDDRSRDGGWRNDGRYNNRGYYDRRYDDRRWDTRRGYGYRDYGWNNGYRHSWWGDTLRFALGMTIFAGDPYAYRFDYGWRPGFDYRYSMRQGVSYGGLALDIEPASAEVYIDGEYVGIAGDFGGQPVPVAPGSHRVEFFAPGCDPVALDIRVMPGQVIPYRGTLYPSSYYDGNGYGNGANNNNRNYGYYERY